MKTLKDLLSAKNPQPIALDDQTVFYIFKKAVKEEFGNIGIEKFLPEYFGNKTLIVRATSSTWAGELWLNKDKILRIMNRELGEGSVERLKTK